MGNNLQPLKMKEPWVAMVGLWLIITHFTQKNRFIEKKNGPNCIMHAFFPKVRSLKMIQKS